MITLDECILHAEEVAENQGKDADKWEQALRAFKGRHNQDSISIHDCEKSLEKCRKCAEEHRQLAEWLKDYKRLLAIESGIDVRCGNCKHDGIDSDRCNECYWYSKWEEESD